MVRIRKYKMNKLLNHKKKFKFLKSNTFIKYICNILSDYLKIKPKIFSVSYSNNRGLIGNFLWSIINAITKYIVYI